MRIRSLVPALLVTAIASLPLLSCFSERTSVVAPGGDGCEIPASAIGTGRAVVLIRDFTFLPDTLRVRPGTTVTWVNCEAASVEPHTSTGAGGTWDSGLLDPGQSFARTFSATGTNAYFCQPHPSMTGTIIVQ
jgi:plastocyanin